VILRITVDVNGWVSHYLSLSKARPDSAAQRLVRSVFSGHCRLGPVQPIISHLMLDTLLGVLTRLGLAEPVAEAARDAVEAAATGGVVPQAPYIVLGGGVQPVRDAEDGGVLDTAVAGAADLLITNNIDDFLPGPRAGIDAKIIRLGANRKPDAVLVMHGRLPHGLVIATAFAAEARLVQGVSPPAGILARFL
jgi:predicted nucleic acid-binding protein